MKVIIPESSENCINIHELTGDYLILGYVNGKPFCVIIEDSCGEFIAIGSTSYTNGPITDPFPSISEVIVDLKDTFPDMTFEAYE